MQFVDRDKNKICTTAHCTWTSRGTMFRTIKIDQVVEVTHTRIVRKSRKAFNRKPRNVYNIQYTIYRTVSVKKSRLTKIFIDVREE